MMQIKCPCCQGSGKIEEQAPVHLSPMQFKIYDIVRKSKYGIEGSRLVDKVYADREDGGPDNASISVHVSISILNRRLAPVKQRVGCHARGRGGIYKLVRL